ncbi:Egl nine 3, partial [Borealophlyctis nickersoniae]
MPPVTPTLVSSLPNDLQLKILSLLQTQTPSTSAPPTQLHAPPAALPTHVNPHRILHNVAAEGYCILDGFVEGGGAGEVLGACQALEKDGSLRPAGMGTGITRNVDSSIRGDKTKYFLNGDLVSTDKGFGDSMDSRRTAPEPIISLKQKLDALVGHFNQSLFQDTSNTPSSHLLTPKGLQIAYYPPNGARYVKHRDASPLNPNRRITILLYLNEGWESEHGGHLRMYAPAPVVGGDTYTDIPPIMNRLVIFRSDLEHEVLPSFANRFAITMWLYSTRDVASLLSALATTSLPAADSEPTLSPPPPPPPTIFVSVPSYRDPETHHTVSSLLKTATHPSRIHVGILYQDHPTEDVALHDQHALPSHSHIRTLHIPSHDAKGPAYARALIAQKLYAGETYYFQVDSHMRFAEGWDTYLVDLVTTAGGKSVVTMYPPGYTLPSTGGGEANDDDTAAKGGDKAILASAPYGPVIMYPHRFDTDDMLRVSGRLTFPFPPAQTANSPPHDLVPQKFVAAG